MSIMKIKESEPEEAEFNATLREKADNVITDAIAAQKSGDHERAIQLCQDFIQENEHRYMDDITDYYCCQNFFEVLMFGELTSPQKEVRIIGVPFDELYMIIGSSFLELGEAEYAEQALYFAHNWNPMCAEISFEHTECLKMHGDMDRFRDEIMDIFQIAYTKGSVARAYRYLAFYFSETEEWEAANMCCQMSLIYEEHSKVQEELAFIDEQSQTEYAELTPASMLRIAKTYGIPLGPSQDIINLAISRADSYMEDEERQEDALYLYEIAYDLTDNPKLIPLIHELEEKYEHKNPRT